LKPGQVGHVIVYQTLETVIGCYRRMSSIVAEPNGLTGGSFMPPAEAPTLARSTSSITGLQASLRLASPSARDGGTPLSHSRGRGRGLFIESSLFIHLIMLQMDRVPAGSSQVKRAVLHSLKTKYLSCDGSEATHDIGQRLEKGSKSPRQGQIFHTRLPMMTTAIVSMGATNQVPLLVAARPSIV